MSPIATSWTSSSCWSGVSPSSPAWSLTPPPWTFLSCSCVEVCPFYPLADELVPVATHLVLQADGVKGFYVDWLLCWDTIVPPISSGNNCSINSSHTLDFDDVPDLKHLYINHIHQLLPLIQVLYNLDKHVLLGVSRHLIHSEDGQETDFPSPANCTPDMFQLPVTS